jgi:hypothetical protein
MRKLFKNNKFRLQKDRKYPQKDRKSRLIKAMFAKKI